MISTDSINDTRPVHGVVPDSHESGNGVACFCGDPWDPHFGTCSTKAREDLFALAQKAIIAPEPVIEEIYFLSRGENLDLIFDLTWIEKAMARDFGNKPDVIIETRKAIQFYLDSGDEILGYGRTRICFANGKDRVIKIPFTCEGYKASSNEVITYGNFQKRSDDDWTITSDWIPTAECRFFQIPCSNVPLLSMERVERPRFGEPRPEWVDCVDCGQVGYNSKGELVAYDL
jgi:hypothetical protein